ncbi:hypothetical protein GCM10009808_24400 [Microbacterium sediminicola]|uniref:ABC transporter substrate-binding protein n=1 Tax=Microbacterium sediminicola TaxID=415210 RepID=A0ABN2II68_9MICO
MLHRASTHARSRLLPVRAGAVVLTAATALAVAGCSTSTDTADTADVAADSPLATCPSTVVIQTGWFPEAEHAAAYQLAGPDGVIDGEAGTYTGEIEGTGIAVEVRSGATYIGYQPMSSMLYQDTDIMFGLDSTLSTIVVNPTTPVVGVFAPYEMGFEAFIWDPAVLDIDASDPSSFKDSGATILAEEYKQDMMKLLEADGVVDSAQADFSYDGSLGRFVTEDGNAILIGYATNEPYRLVESTEEWGGRPLESVPLADLGYEVYGEVWTVRPEVIEEQSECLSALIPLVQQAELDYLADPEPINQVINDLVAAENSFWTMDMDHLAQTAEMIRDNGYVFAGTTDTYGDFDLDRVDRVIADYQPILEATGRETTDLTAADIVTNEFIDPSITWTDAQ